jgi:hypothetical protein
MSEEFSQPPDKADADLIAAAPEMRERIRDAKLLLRECAYLIDDLTPYAPADDTRKSIAKLLADVRNVIGKI